MADPPDPRDPAAADLLRHGAFIRRIAIGVLGDPDHAEDVTQDTLVTAWRRPPRASVRHWLRRVATRFALRTRRSEERRRRREAEAARPERIPSSTREQEETFRRVTDAVLRLPQPAKEVVLLRFYEDLFPAAIAARLGISVTAVRSRLRRALDELRRNLTRAFGDEPTAWRSALAGLSGIPLHPAEAELSLGGIAMKLKLCAAALAAVGLWFAFDRLLATEGGALPDDGLTAESGQRAGPEPGRSAATDHGAGEHRKPVGDPDRAAAGSALLCGRVVDDHRRPASGCAVEIRFESGVSLEGHTGEDGCFAIPWRGFGTQRGGIFALGANGRAGIAALRVELRRGARCDLGTLVILPAGRLEVRARDGGRPAAGVQVLARPTGFPIGYRWEVHRWSAQTDGEGVAAFATLVPGRYRIEILDPAGPRASTVVDVTDAEPARAEVDIAGGCTATVLVVDAGDGSPVDAATLTVHEIVALEGGGAAAMPIPASRATDPAGLAVIPGCRGGQPLRVRVERPGYRTVESMWTVDPDGPSRLQVALPPIERRRVRWPLSPSATTPAEGSAVGFLGLAFGAEPVAGVRGRIDAGHLVAEGPIPAGVQWMARAADGTLARVETPGREAQVGAEVDFRRPRSCTVRLLAASDRRPLAGWPVIFHHADRGPCEPVRTDEEGRAVLGGLWGGVVVARLDDDPASKTPDEFHLGRRDVSTGDAILEVLRPDGVPVTAHVSVDGSRRLPPRIALHPDNGWCRDLVEDPETGTLEFTLWPHEPDEPVCVYLYGPWGYSAGEARLGGPWVGPRTVELRMERRASAVASVVPPADGQLQLYLMRQSGAQWSIWSHVKASNLAAAPLPPFRNLRRGRYRLLDESSGVYGPAVDIRPGDQARLTIDLSRVVAVAGRVEVPDGVDVRKVQVFVEVGEGHRGPPATLPDANGRFEVRAPLDATPVVRAQHPELRPAPDHGSAAVTGATLDLRLVLVAKVP